MPEHDEPMEMVTRHEGEASAPEVRYLGDLSRLAIQPGDKFVLTHARCLSDEAQARIKGVWKSFAGDVPLLILDQGFRLGLINTEATPGG